MIIFGLFFGLRNFQQRAEHISKLVWQSAWNSWSCSQSTRHLNWEFHYDTKERLIYNIYIISSFVVLFTWLCCDAHSWEQVPAVTVAKRAKIKKIFISTRTFINLYFWLWYQKRFVLFRKSAKKINCLRKPCHDERTVLTNLALFKTC